MTQPQTQIPFQDRNAERAEFLDKSGCAAAHLTPVGEDCAFRRYFRLPYKNDTAILMETVPEGDGRATPGHNLRDFIRIGAFLRQAGLHTPEIYEADPRQGYALLEDCGDLSFKKALESGETPEMLYGLAVDVLAVIRNAVDASAIALPDYESSHVHAGARRIVDWYMPALRGERNPDGLAEDFLAVWETIEKSLPPCPRRFLHIDFHVENLMVIPDAQGIARCGILDFQGAMSGPAPYDLANLLEDVRHDIPLELRQKMLTRYGGGEDLAIWYRILATRFHCRVAGQFIRIALKDGKQRYLQHLPRIAAYLQDGLTHPVLRPLADWFAEQGVNFTVPPAIDMEALKPLIRADAF